MSVRPHGLPAITAIALLLIGLACDRNIEPYVEGEAPRSPDVASILPDTGERSPAPPARGVDPSPESAIRGRIEIAAELAPNIPEPALLFLMARPASSPGGPPVAVKRLSATSFPVPFQIGAENMMQPGTPFVGSYHLSVRLDSDGEAMTKTPGDLVGTSSRSVSPGSSDVLIVLDRKL